MNRDCKHFYDCWDVMTLTTDVGLLSLLAVIAEEEDLDISSLDETTFIWLVEKIFARIDLSGRWSATPTWGTEDFKSDELLMFSLGLHLISFLCKMQNS